jgi:hypothetical protein
MTQAPQLISVKQCVTSLDFKPESPWPVGLPSVAIQGFIIAGFSSSEFVFNHLVEPNSPQALDIWKSVHPELSFAECARLAQKLGQSPWTAENLLSLWGFAWRDQQIFSAEWLLRQTESFQKWAAQKKIAPNDIAGLRLADPEKLFPFLSQVIQLDLSKSFALQLLELTVDLLYFDENPEKILSLWPKNKNDVEFSLKHLRALRYPQTTSMDTELEGKMKKLPWPGTSQAKWVRHGDRAGIELKLFVSQPSDLKKYLISLERVQNLLEQSPSEKDLN